MTTNPTTLRTEPAPAGYILVTAGDLNRLRADMENARTAYHQRIAEANARGISTRRLAHMIGVSHQTVHNIITAQRKS